LSSAINEAISIFSIAASLGAAFANYAVGAIGDVLGLGWGIAFVLLLIVIELILALILMQRGEKKCTT
jgi:sugar phosphate permease